MNKITYYFLNCGLVFRKILKKLLPRKIVTLTRSFVKRIKRKIYLVRISKPVTKIMGSLYRVNHERIELVITFDCNLKCLNCNRSCRQAPSLEYMTVRQIEKFIMESQEKNRRWKLINIMGGEPTLHPDIFTIVELLIAYKRRFNPDVQLALSSNGYGSTVKEALARMPPEIFIITGNKETIFQDHFYAFNDAPIDLDECRKVDYLNKCKYTAMCGLSLTKSGYYLCSNAAGIDRILGFNLGRKELPPVSDLMNDQARIFCPYCGAFKPYAAPARGEEISPSWGSAYYKYKKKKPELTDY